MSPSWWRLVRAFAWIAVRCYYRAFRREHVERIPAEGPVLFVLNHPNSLLDPAVLLLSSPRPVHFAAKGPLFRAPVIGFVLRKLGAVPIERPQDAGSDLRRNLQAFSRMVEVLRGGGACAIFPEGISHLDPELKTVKSGPARVALEAEEAAGWILGLRVVPVGLTFHPRQAFRGEVVVRVGEPFRVDDLRETQRHAAIRTVQARIEASLKPLVHHLDRVDLAPLVERAADLYAEHRRQASPGAPPLSREEILRLAGTVLNHLLVSDPAAVQEVEEKIRRYDRLSGRAGVTAQAVRLETQPARAFLGWAGRGLLLVLGFPVWAYGSAAAAAPYFLTDMLARRLERPAGGATALPLLRVGCGAAVFGAFWGLLCWLMLRWSGSAVVTALFAASLPLCGLLARLYWLRARTWIEGLESLLPYFARRRAVTRVAEVRAEVLTLLQDLARRTEAAAGRPLVAPAEARYSRPFPWGKCAALALAGGGAWFLAGLRGTGFDEIASTPSPWNSLPAAEAGATAQRDAVALASRLESLGALSRRTAEMRADFASGRRDFYDPATDAEIRRSLLTYLSCREGLLRLAWFYKDSPRPEPGLRRRGFLLGYASAVELCARGMEFVDAFDGHPDAVRKLNEGVPEADLPAGTYDRIRRNLADSDLLDALAAATDEFRGLAEAGDFEGPEWKAEPWPTIVSRARDGARVAETLSGRLWSYKWRSAAARAVRTGDTGRYRASSVVSTWIGDARVRSRPEGHGLVSRSQVESLRARMKPGDILVERRNWYLSNMFLPGFWKHAAIYLGGVEGVRSLGIAEDPAVAPHMAALEAPDPEGRRRDVIEAVSEGVMFTSLEESIGGADAVCAFRPRLPREAVAAAVARAIAQQGKPYDFDFDFFSSDRLVCTEVVYQAYQGPIRFDLPEIMGRRTLPALEIVRMWDRGRGRPDACLDLVGFLDGDEEHGTAAEAGEEALRASMDRPGSTGLQRGASGLPLFVTPPAAALAAMLFLGVLLFRRRRPRNLR